MIDAIYIDTSCLLKLVILESDSERAHTVCRSTGRVIVSSLTALEARSRLLAFRRGGVLRHEAYRRTTRDLDGLLKVAPFQLANLGGDVFDVAIARLKERRAMACRSLDRLHLAAMEVLGLSTLFTRDARQASVARGMGYRVID